MAVTPLEACYDRRMWAILRALWHYGGGDTPAADFTAYGFPRHEHVWLDTKGQWRDLHTDPPSAYEPRFRSVFAALTMLERCRH